MATNGIDATSGALILGAMNGTQASFSVTAPLRCLFHTATRSADNGTDTEFTTSSGYVRGVGSLYGGTALAFAAATSGAAGAAQNSNVAASVANMPAGTWTGCSIVDSKYTQRTVTDGATTNASATITSATASFTASDVGAVVTGSANLPSPNAVIISVTNSTTAVLDRTCSASSTSQTFNIQRPNSPQTTFWAQLSSSKTVNAGDTVTVPSGSWQTTLA